MRVVVDVEEEELKGEYKPVEGLRLTWSRCGHQVEVFGTDQDSARRGAVMLRKECPKGENNFYIVDKDYE